MDYQTMSHVDAMREAKAASGMTDEEIAKAANISVHAVRQYQRPRDGYAPGLDKIPTLCRVMGNNILLSWIQAQADPRALCDIPPATSRAEVLTAVARVSATLGDAQRRLADSELSGIDPECARDVRGLMNDVIEDCRVVMAKLLPIAQFRDRTRCYPLLSKAHNGSEYRKPWWRFWS
ncbi:XRE family transcriptional regulator [uncultured Desulfovibrio sp.]|uniref:XRE family transcriptional regulator n=1 Tax=uncultured Desulfovibrio sp. TaxID=167968 RepID=UPI002868AC43|nr:XRE family transcriptional regulator [uncultured Desulfovibrio sp.]